MVTYSYFFLLVQVVFIVSIMINLGYWVVIFPKITQLSKKTVSIDDEIPVSIIICAKNEAKNLQILVPLLLQQSYKTFEIVIADDCSCDETNTIISDFSLNHGNVQIVTITKNTLGKKHAIQKAMDLAQFEMLLFTDADCRPEGTLWIEKMIHNLGSKKLIIGYGPMIKTKTWLNKYIRYETFLTAVQYLSYASWKRPYMAVGRNMGYKKELFIANNGFETHKHITSGDDDLFVNALSSGDDVTICLEPGSFMYSKAKDHILSYFNQKTRHYSTAIHYKWFDKLSLGLFAFSHIVLYFSFIYLCFTSLWTIALMGYMMRVLFIMLVSPKMFQILAVKDLWYYFPILDILTLLYYTIFIPASIFPRSNRW